MTTEYTYYTSGDWKATCTLCGAEELFESLAKAYTAASKHRKTHP